MGKGRWEGGVWGVKAGGGGCGKERIAGYKMYGEGMGGYGK